MVKRSEAIHPAANLFPLMSETQLKELAADIRANGQREPIVYYGKQVLDGRNRMKACAIAGVEPDSCEIDDDNGFDPIAFVLSVNLHRRHLNESQRATVAAKLKKMLEPEAKERKSAGQKSGGRGRKKNSVANLPPSKNGKSRDQAAELLNVSGKSVDHASAVIEHGSPELVAAVERGEVAVSRAAKVAKGTPKNQQLAAAKEKTQATETTPFDHLKHWWELANETQRCVFRNWIDGKL